MNIDKYRVAVNITEYNHTDILVLIIKLPRFLKGD